MNKTPKKKTPIQEHDGNSITVQSGGEPRVDSRLIAKQLGVKHKNTFELLQKYKEAFIEIGILPFKTEVIKGRGQPEKFALLNENQAVFLLTMSRNTPRVIALKLELVKAFAKARQAAELRKTEYLPANKELHDTIKTIADGATHEKWWHITANKALNDMAGLEAGQRPKAGAMQLSKLIVGAAILANHIEQTGGIKGYKQVLQPLADLQLR